MAPLPFGAKLCFSVEARTICLTESVPLAGPEELGLALAELALVLVLALAELALAELGLVLTELELEHPAIPSRLAATNVAPSRVDDVLRLKMFTR